MTDQALHPDALNILGVKGRCRNCEEVQRCIGITLTGHAAGTPVPNEAVRATAEIGNRIGQCDGMSEAELGGTALVPCISNYNKP